MNYFNILKTETDQSYNKKLYNLFIFCFSLSYHSDPIKFSFVMASFNLALEGVAAFRRVHRPEITIVKSELDAKSNQNFMDLVPRPPSSANFEAGAFWAELMNFR